MSAIDLFIEKARQGAKKLVLPEGQDPRVVTAANMIIEDKIAIEVIVLGTESEIAASCAKANIAKRKFKCLDYLNCDLFEKYAEQFKKYLVKQNCWRK